MIKMIPEDTIDDDFLKAMGYEKVLPEHKRQVKENLLRALDLRVGKRVAETLSDEQLDKFEEITADESRDNVGEVVEWLDKTLPDFRQIIEEEAAAMRDETVESMQAVFGDGEAS